MSSRFFQGGQYALGFFHLRWRRRKDFIRQCDLRGMYRPFSFAPQCGCAASRQLIAVRILDVAKRAIDRPQTIGAARYRHAADCEMPLVAGIIRIQSADIDRSGAVTGGVVSNAEMQRLQPSARAVAGNVLNIGHAQRGFDQRFQSNPVFQALLHFQLINHGFHHVDIRVDARLGYQ